jgi:hypothetical protein
LFGKGSFITLKMQSIAGSSPDNCRDRKEGKGMTGASQFGVDSFGFQELAATGFFG